MVSAHGLHFFGLSKCNNCTTNVIHVRHFAEGPGDEVEDWGDKIKAKLRVCVNQYANSVY